MIEMAYYQYVELEQVLGHLAQYVNVEEPKGFYTRCMLVNGTIIKPIFEE